MEELISSLRSAGVLRSKSIVEALRHVDRKLFLPLEIRADAYKDVPLPIGYNQTISQPTTVVFMLELLQAEAGDNILDIGSGSGWQTALLAHIVRPTGHITGIERIQQLHAQALMHCEKLNLITDGRVNIYCGNAQDGYIPNAPYSHIICAASIDAIPRTWVNQLSDNGHHVSPVRESIVHLYKKGNHVTRREYPGFLFVPFVSE